MPKFKKPYTKPLKESAGQALRKEYAQQEEKARALVEEAKKPRGLSDKDKERKGWLTAGNANSRRARQESV